MRGEWARAREREEEEKMGRGCGGKSPTESDEKRVGGKETGQSGQVREFERRVHQHIRYHWKKVATGITDPGTWRQRRLIQTDTQNTWTNIKTNHAITSSS